MATRVLTVKTPLVRNLRDPLSRSPSRNPSGPCATEGLCRRGRRKSAANDGSEEQISHPRGWKSPRGGQRHLVHRIHIRSRLDRYPAADPQRRSHSRSGHRRVVPRSLLHRASLPLLAELVTVGRRGSGCRAHRRPHRRHAERAHSPRRARTVSGPPAPRPSSRRHSRARRTPPETSCRRSSARMHPSPPDCRGSRQTAAASRAAGARALPAGR